MESKLDQMVIWVKTYERCECPLATEGLLFLVALQTIV